MKRMLFAIVKKYYKLLLSVTLVVSLGFSLAWGLSAGYLSLEDSLYRYVDDYAYPDGYITTEVTSSDDAEKLLSIDGVQRCDTRLCADTVMKTTDGRCFSVRAFSYSENEKQKFYLWSDCSGGSNGILVEYNFASSNGISAGDTLSFRIRGEYRDFTVQGIISRPETLSAKISEDAWGLNYDFGYIYAPISLLRDEYEKDYLEAKKEIDGNSDELTKEKNGALKLLKEKQDELDKAKKTLDEKKKDYTKLETEAAKALAELKKTKEELLASLSELAEKEKLIKRGYQSADGTLSSLTEQYDKLTQAKNALDELDKTERKLNDTRTLLSGSDITQSIRILKLVPGGTVMSELFSGAESLSKYLAEMEDYGFSYDISASVSESEAIIRRFEAQLDDYLAYLDSQQVKDLIDRIASGSITYSEFAAVIQRFSDMTGTDLSKLPEYYQTAITNLTSLRQEYSELDIDRFFGLLKEIETDRSAEELMKSIISARSQLNDLSDDTEIEKLTASETLSVYENALSEVDKGIETVIRNRKTILSELSAYDIDAASLTGSLTELKKGIAAAKEAKADLKKTLYELSKGVAEINSGIKEIESTISEIDDQLSDGRSQIGSAEKKIADGEKQLKSSADGLKEFADLEEELERAYEKLDENDGYDKLCNQFMLYLDDDANAKSIMASAERVLEDASIKSSYVFEDSPVKTRIKNNLEPIHSLMLILPSVFFAVVLTVVFLFKSMIINQSRREIGIMTALGISKTSIRSLFAAIGACVSVAGIVIGSGIGYLLLRYIGGYFVRLFPLPEFCYHFNPAGYLIGAAACAFVCLSATLLSTVRISRITPKEAMSRQTQTTAHIPAVIARLMRRFSPMMKFSVTSLLRNKGRFLFSTFCVAASVMFIFASISFIKSKNFIIDQTFDQRIHYDCQILLKDKPSAELMSAIEKLDGVSGVEEVLVYEIALTSQQENIVRDVTVYAMRPQNTMIGVYGSTGEELTVEPGGFIIERHTAQELGVFDGDRIIADEVEMPVSGVSDQCVGRVHYIALSDAEKFGEPDLGCILCQFDGDPRRSLLALLAEDNSYLYTVFTDNMFTYNKQLFATYDLAAWILIIFAVLTGFIIVLNTALTNLQEDKRELCVLRTLGFQHSEISRNRFSHSVLQLIFAYVLGLIPAILFTKSTLLSISTETEEFVYASGFPEVVIASAIVFLYMVISHFAAMRSMKKWDPAEEIKDKE